MARNLLVLFLIFLLSPCLCCAWRADSLASALSVDTPIVRQSLLKKAFSDNIPYVGLGLVASGFAVRSQKEDFRELRHYFKPNFHTTWDNYTQYTPFLAAWALKACGVEGRSSWKRMAVSNVLSFGTMALLVNSIKHSTRELRPDGTSRNSFPSGHTATSFVCATILHREYGLTRSPWYSIAGYSVATVTGVCRILNNRHWANDVLVGAGVGIVSTNVGYFLGDLLFKDKGIQRTWRTNMNPDLLKHHSFLSLGVQIGTGPRHLNMAEVYDNYDENMHPYETDDPRGVSHPLGLRLRLGTSSSVKAEGAYFLNRYFGIGGSLRATVIPLTATVDLTKGFRYNLNKNNPGSIGDQRFARFVGVESNHIGMFDYSGGAYFSYPFNNRLRFGTKLLIGRRLTTAYNVDALLDVDVPAMRSFIQSLDPSDKRYFASPEDKEEFLNTMKSWGDGRNMHNNNFLSIKANRAIVYETGLSLTWAYKGGMALMLSMDYDYANPKYVYELNNRWETDTQGIGRYVTDTFKRRTSMHHLSLGLGVVLSL